MKNTITKIEEDAYQICIEGSYVDLVKDENTGLWFLTIENLIYAYPTIESALNDIL